ncbi:hypothetical protein GCM10022403_087300 [Streptomyces coacervatus]|uniref:DNA primase/polymerase bifunctional N-terminal domain-containing protein n=1 Tax=Streptomyces coacervatus TaxID=647381 RepID=A0ABP7JDQ5_9ACTN|nr:bifunctional DNA primase/polymerase [Streptomyces coacervatus]MDF2273393.1 bifunctional DNA primase/polymerase [Streptomyces coacervatus]
MTEATKPPGNWTQEPTPPVVAAINYALHGWKVFPLSPGSKEPLPGTRGFLDATSDITTIVHWFGQWPKANVGIATDAESGIWILDVDPKNDGPRSLEALRAGLGDESLMDTYTVRTPSGGLHLYYVWPDGARLPRKINLFKGQGMPGIDLLGSGGYAVAPPSCTAEGAYTVVQELPIPDIPKAPPCLLDAIRTAMAPWTAVRGVRGPQPCGQVRAPLRSGTAGIVRWLENVRPGEQDNAIAWGARALRDKGLTPRETAALLRQAMQQMEISGRPWSEADVRRHIRSTYKGGSGT